MAAGGPLRYLAVPDEEGANTKALLVRQEPSDAARLETSTVQFAFKQHLELTGEQWAIGTLQGRERCRGRQWRQGRRRRSSGAARRADRRQSLASTGGMWRGRQSLHNPRRSRS